MHDISLHFSNTITNTSTHDYELRELRGGVSQIQQLGVEMAENIVEYFSQGVIAPCHASWLNKRKTGMHTAPQWERILSSTFMVAIGTQNKPKATDHLEGFVSEFLWYFITRSNISAENIKHIEGPSISATDNGGDGLVFHEISSGDYLFRLWEIKKNTSVKGTVSSTVTTAYNQIQRRVYEYLARYLQVYELMNHPDKKISALTVDLIEHWENQTPQAALGICVNSSSSKKPTKCYSGLGKQFNGFVTPKRLVGYLTLPHCMSSLTTIVTREIWAGI